MCNKELKIYQKKGREREYSPFCVRKYRLNGREKKIFIVNKMGRKRVKIKGK